MVKTNPPPPPPAILPVSLKDWEIKTLLQDIESSGVPLQDVTLETLSPLNQDYYGTARHTKYKVRRAAVSYKLQDLKRRSATSYLKFVRSYGVAPSQSTVDAAAIAPAAVAPAAVAPVAAPPPIDDPMAGFSEQFDNLNMDDSNSYVMAPPVAHNNPSVTTPPRRLMSPQPAMFDQYIKSPNHPPSLPTPPRSLQLPTVASVDSSSYAPTLGSRTWIGCRTSNPSTPAGSFDNPWIFNLVPGFSGRYMNNIWCYEQDNQVCVKDNKKHGYGGFLFKKKIDPPDVALHSCFIAHPTHVERLCANGAIHEDEKNCNEFIVFCSPYIEACDRVGRGGIINHQWVDPTCKDTVKKVHAKIKRCNPKDDQSGPSWCYTVAKLNNGTRLENRVHSDHDYDVAPYESCPEKTYCDDIGEDVTSFHVMWRIAWKGTEELLDEAEEISLKERIKARREQNNPNRGGFLGIGGSNNNNNNNNNNNS